MRIGTWNLNVQWSDKHSALLQREKCDIWLLTEVSPRAVNPKGKIAGFHCHLSSGVMARKQHWAAVLSLLAPSKLLPDPHPASAAAIVNGITYCSTILPWKDKNASGDPWVGSSQAARTGAAIDQILKGLNQILKGPPKSDLVWGGDWNHSLVGRDWAGSKAGRDHILEVLKKRKLNLQVPTAGLPHRLGDGQYSIDHVAVPWAWDVRCACRVPATGLSDHDAYIIEVYQPGERMKNSIFVIKPYKWEGMWVFDDPNVGLVREPFVSGADTMIDVATAHIPNANQGFLAVFSASYFPDAQIVLEWVKEDGSGNVYRWAEKAMEGWLCPALLKYFEQPPAKLHIQVKAAGQK